MCTGLKLRDTPAITKFVYRINRERTENKTIVETTHTIIVGSKGNCREAQITKGTARGNNDTTLRAGF